MKGGAAVVGVALEGGEPRVVLSTFLATGAEGDRLSLEPYHVAAELRSHGTDSNAAAAAVAEGRLRQDRLAATGLGAIVRTLEDARRTPAVAALLVNRAGWVTDELEYSLAWPEHVPDEKSLPDIAARALDTTPTAIGARLSGFGASAGKPWRKEQKLACLAAWFAIAAHRS